MRLIPYTLVLISAFTHAYWNFILKRAKGTQVFIGLSKVAEIVLFAARVENGEGELRGRAQAGEHSFRRPARLENPARAAAFSEKGRRRVPLGGLFFNLAGAMTEAGAQI